MAVKSVKFTLNGTTYDLAYDSASGTYKATLTAPTTTSWNQADHKYYGTVVAEDTAGNSVTATKDTFAELGLRVKETVKPVIEVTAPTTGAYLASNKPAITWKVTDTGSGIDPDTISVKIDGGSAVTGAGITKVAITNGYSCTYTPGSALSDGAHTVVFAVSDNDGNAASQASVAFTVDTVPPTLSVTAPADNLSTNSRSVAFAGKSNDTLSSPVTLTYKVDNGSEVAVTVGSDGSFSGTIQLPDTDGTHTVTFTAKDAAGKTTTVTRTINLDTVAPVISSVVLAPNPVDAGATYTITVTVSD